MERGQISRVHAVKIGYGTTLAKTASLAPLLSIEKNQSNRYAKATVDAKKSLGPVVENLPSTLTKMGTLGVAQTCLQVELKFFHERETLAVDFYVSCGKSERQSESFALGPTTGTGNEKRRTFRKSRTSTECSRVPGVVYPHWQMYHLIMRHVPVHFRLYVL